MNNHLLMTRAERRMIAEHLRERGYKIQLGADSETLTRLVCEKTGMKYPKTLYERMQILTGFRDKLKDAKVRNLAPSRTPPVFKPLKFSREMNRLIERSKEIRAIG